MESSNDYYRYSYCGVSLLIGLAVNFGSIAKVLLDYRRRKRNGNNVDWRPGRSATNFNAMILICFVASSNILLLITRDLGHLLEMTTTTTTIGIRSSNWTSTDFVCKFYKFWTFLACHLCSYSVSIVLVFVSWYVFRETNRSSSARINRGGVAGWNRSSIWVAVAWTLGVAFCSPFYHVSGLKEENSRRVCYTIRVQDESRANDVVFAYYPYFLIATILILPIGLVLVLYIIFGPKIVDGLKQKETSNGHRSSVRLIQVINKTGGGVANEDEGEPIGKDEIDRKGPHKPDRRSLPKEKSSISTRLEVMEGNSKEQPDSINSKSDWNVRRLCLLGTLIPMVYLICWIPYSIVYLLVAKGDLDPSMLGVTIPTYILYLVYPILSGVCLIVV